MIAKDGLYLTGSLDIESDLGEVLLRKHPFHMTVRGRVNLSLCE